MKWAVVQQKRVKEASADVEEILLFWNCSIKRQVDCQIFKHVSTIIITCTKWGGKAGLCENLEKQIAEQAPCNRRLLANKRHVLHLIKRGFPFIAIEGLRRHIFPPM